MKRVIISKNVDLNGYTSKYDWVDSAVTVGKAAFGATVFGLTGLALVTADKIIKESETHIIESADELDNYIHCWNKPWEKIVYIEHPRIKNYLIPEKDYKKYILREVVADISNYISDNIAISELTFGLVTSQVAGLGAGFPINEIQADAKLKCKISKSYCHHVTNVPCSNKKYNSIWIDTFKDIKSAIDNKAGSMENIVKSSFDFSISFGLADTIKGVFNIDKKLEFYIRYIKA